MFMLFLIFAKNMIIKDLTPYVTPYACMPAIEHVGQSVARIRLDFFWPCISGFGPASISQDRTYRY